MKTFAFCSPKIVIVLHICSNNGNWIQIKRNGYSKNLHTYAVYTKKEQTEYLLN